MENASLVQRMKGKTQIGQLIEIVIVLGMTSVLFVLLETNMMVFGFFVYPGFVWMIISTPNRKVSLITGIVGGIVGALTEYWGCSNHLWNWVVPCKSIWMVGGQESGFPVEVAIAYFAAGFWITKISINLFGPEHEQTQEFYSNQGLSNNLVLKIAAALIIDAVGLAVILTEPVYLQSTALFMAGSNIVIFLSKPAMKMVGGFAVIMGFIGLFFENFATGFFESFAVWRYDLALHSNLEIPIPLVGIAPFTAFIAYAGTGMVLFGLSFLLNRQNSLGDAYA